MKQVIFTFLFLAAFIVNATANETLDRTGWTATVSTNFNGNDTHNMFDGNVSTEWNSLQVQVPGDWMIVDMQEEQTFNQIVFSQENAPGDHPAEFAIYVSNDPDDFGDIVATGSGVTAIQSKVDIFAEQTGRYIKIELTGNRGAYWKVCELYVNRITEKDDRFGWSMTASFNNDSANRGLDGDFATSWESGPQLGVEWVVLDMKHLKTFNQILLNQRGASGDYPRDYEVYVSNDGATWGDAIVTGRGSNDVTKINFSTDLTARYIKITQKENVAGGLYWKISEIYVKQESAFRFATATAYRNEGNANKALDRDLTTKWSNEEVQAGGETFTIDLGSSLVFDYIELINGGDDPESYAIYTSDDPDNFGEAIATGNGSQDKTEINFSNQTARYIKIEQTGVRGSYWAIDELYIDLKTPIDPKNGWIMTASHNNENTIGALDLDPETRWSTNAVQAGGEYIILDLQNPTTFNQIALFNNGDNPNKYDVYLSDDVNDFGEVALSGAGTSGTTEINFADAQTARYIKIVQTGTSGGYWSIYELDVKLLTDMDYRFGWTMTASYNSESAGLTLDGKSDTKWHSGPQLGVEWIIIDMKQPRVFNMIHMEHDPAGDYPREYSVYLSNDVNDFGETVTTGNGTEIATRIDFATDQTARYIKIEQTGSSGGIYWAISELHVKKADYRFGWTATAFNRESGGIPEIFDMDINTGWSTEAVQAPGQWIIVDMKKAQLFNQVVLEINTSHGGDYPRGYELYVSDNPENWGKALVASTGTEGAETKINIYTNQAARYIKIVQTGTSGGYWAIEEFHINRIEDTDYRFGWTMTASNNNEKTALALDNDPDTKWDSGPQNGVEWIIVDMKRAQTFNTILLNGGGDYPREYNVYVSNDADEFGEPIATGAGADGETKISLATQNARYIKIAQTGQGGGIYWSINEFNITNMVAIDQINEGRNLLYYAEGQLFLEEVLLSSTLNVYNVSGQKVKTIFNSEKVMPFDLTAGIYIITVENGTTSYRQKLLVK